MQISKALAKRGLLFTQVLAVGLLLAGMSAMGIILGMADIQPELHLHAGLFLEATFTLLMGATLIAIAFCLPKWFELLQTTVWVLAILGLGLLFMYGAIDLADSFVLSQPGGWLDVLEKAARVLGCAVLAFSIGMWIRE
ncbi:MAG: hypothetical protein R6V55_10960, partial [Desulfovermiculus sp.]